MTQSYDLEKLRNYLQVFLRQNRLTLQIKKQMAVLIVQFLSNLQILYLEFGKPFLVDSNSQSFNFISIISVIFGLGNVYPQVGQNWPTPQAYPNWDSTARPFCKIHSKFIFRSQSEFYIFLEIEKTILSQKNLIMICLCFGKLSKPMLNNRSVLRLCCPAL